MLLVVEEEVVGILVLPVLPMEGERLIVVIRRELLPVAELVRPPAWQPVGHGCLALLQAHSMHLVHGTCLRVNVGEAGEGGDEKGSEDEAVGGSGSQAFMLQWYKSWAASAMQETWSACCMLLAGEI